MMQSRTVSVIIQSVLGAVLATVIATAISWGLSLEHCITRLESQEDITKRVSTLEDMLTPVLVEFRMREELRKRGLDLTNAPTVTTPKPSLPLPMPVSASAPPTEVNKAKNVGDLMTAIEHDVKSQMKK